MTGSVRDPDDVKDKLVFEKVVTSECKKSYIIFLSIRNSLFLGQHIFWPF